ncbi:transcriptional repressor NrdR [Alcaligenaceae bacterium]|nr:transcriptional repressor NrdR [Alcaligenaceae bacterium]
MRCPFCNRSDTQVIDTRVLEEGDVIRRRRRCAACERRFTTYERAELLMPAVVKRNGTRTEFDIAKLEASMKLALRKRPVSTDAMESAVERIRDKLLHCGQKEVTSRFIGDLVMAELRELDEVAYVRFASVYRSFEDVGEFVKAISEFQSPRGTE